MSKRILVALLALSAISASNALANRARLLVLGTGDPQGDILGGASSGSLSFDDNYNWFYNPAYVNDFKNWATIEKSNGVNARAEGGFVTSISTFSLGLFLNRVDSIRTPYTNKANMRPIDIALGGDMGVKWGVGASVGTFKTGPGNTDANINLKAGVSIADFEPFANWVVKGTEGSANRQHRGYGLGARYHFGEWIPYLAWAQDKIDDAKINNVFAIGLARNAKLADNARLIYSTGFFRQNVGVPAGGGRNIIPIQVAVEGDPLTWLTLRGGLSYRVWDRSGPNSNTDTTTGRLGAGLHLGKADLDFAIGTAPSVSTVADGAMGAEGKAIDTETFGLGVGLFSAASLTYHW